MHLYSSGVSNNFKNMAAEHAEQKPPGLVPNAKKDLGDEEKSMEGEKKGIRRQHGNIHRHLEGRARTSGAEIKWETGLV